MCWSATAWAGLARADRCAAAGYSGGLGKATTLGWHSGNCSGAPLRR